MAKKPEDVLREGVRDTLGNQVLMIIELQAENAILRERIAELTPPPEPSGVASTSVIPG
jgi:hypothetical protein